MPGAGGCFGVDLGNESIANSLTAGAIGANAVGSGQVATNLIQLATFNLSSANILAMNGAPVTVLAAPGAGKSYVIHHMQVRMSQTATAYANGGTVTLIYSTGSVAATGTIATAVFTGAGPATVDAVCYGIGATMGAQNDAIKITNGTAPFITGTGTAVLTIWYSII
jgi:hypothetical protein